MLGSSGNTFALFLPLLMSSKSPKNPWQLANITDWKGNAKEVDREQGINVRVVWVGGCSDSPRGLSRCKRQGIGSCDDRLRCRAGHHQLMVRRNRAGDSFTTRSYLSAAYGTAHLKPR